MGDETDAKLAEYKAQLRLEEVHGHVLELGAGLGPNLKLFGPNVTAYTAVEPNPGFHERLKAQAAAQLPADAKFSLLLASEDGTIALPSDSVDHVVVTLVLCSVPHLEATVAEILRVLKPHGTFRFLEHVRAPQDHAVLRTTQQVVDASRLWALFGDGCEVNRDTLRIIQRTMGWEVEAMAVMSSFGPPFVRPIVFGKATKYEPVEKPQRMRADQMDMGARRHR